MALSDVEVVRLIIGLTANNPFYSLMDDDQIQWFIDYHSGNLRMAARMAAISLSLTLASVNTREITGDLEVYNQVSTAYKAALENLISESAINNLPNGLMPYASGISWSDWIDNDQNPDNIRSKLSQISVCGIDYTVFSC